MAVDSLRDGIRRLLSSQLEAGLRYRCLVIQSSDLMLLRSIQQCLQEILAEQGRGHTVVDGRTQFDSVGAASCQELTDKLAAAADHEYVIIAGPLHFLDYWSRQVRSAFWSYLATVTHGLGMIVLDIPRAEETDKVFRVIGRISGADARYLKSRLATLQDGLI